MRSSECAIKPEADDGVVSRLVRPHNRTKKTCLQSGDDVTAAPVAAPGDLYRLGGMVLAVFLGGMLILLTYYLLVTLQTVLWLFAIGFLVAYFLEPVVRRLQSIGWSRAKAVWTVLMAVVALMLLTGWAVVPALVNQAQDAAVNWSEYSDHVMGTYESLRARFQDWVGGLYPQVGVSTFLDEKIPEARDWLSENVPRMLSWVSRQLVTSVGLLGLAVIVLVISFHFMMLAEALKETVRRLIPPEHTRDVTEVGSEIGAMLGQYVRAIIVLFFANGIGAFIIMWVLSLFFDNKYTLVVAGLTALTNMVPYAGPVISCGSAGYLVYVTARPEVAGLASVLAIVLLFVMSQYFAVILQPMLIGRRINLHPLVVLFAMFAGFEALGLLGIIIGMPVAAVIKIVLAKWIPVIGPGPEVRAPSEPLLLDLAQAFRNARRYVLNLASRAGLADAATRSESTTDTGTDERDEEDATSSAPGDVSSAESTSQPDDIAAAQDTEASQPDDS